MAYQQKNSQCDTFFVLEHFLFETVAPAILASLRGTGVFSTCSGCPLPWPDGCRILKWEKPGTRPGRRPSKHSPGVWFSGHPESFRRLIDLSFGDRYY